MTAVRGGRTINCVNVQTEALIMSLHEFCYQNWKVSWQNFHEGLARRFATNFLEGLPLTRIKCDPQVQATRNKTKLHFIGCWRNADSNAQWCTYPILLTCRLLNICFPTVECWKIDVHVHIFVFFTQKFVCFSQKKQICLLFKIIWKKRSKFSTDNRHGSLNRRPTHLQHRYNI